MSQQTVLQLLQELGGVATSSEIIKLAKEKYPDLSLWQYVGNRLRKLRKCGFVGYDAVSNKYFRGFMKNQRLWHYRLQL